MKSQLTFTPEVHNSSPGANYLSSRPPTTPDVTGRPQRSSKTTPPRAPACSPRYYPEGKVNTGASKQGQRDLKIASISKQLLSQGHQTAKQSSLADERQLPVDID